MLYIPGEILAAIVLWNNREDFENELLRAFEKCDHEIEVINTAWRAWLGAYVSHRNRRNTFSYTQRAIGHVDDMKR